MNTMRESVIALILVFVVFGLVLILTSSVGYTQAEKAEPAKSMPSIAASPSPTPVSSSTNTDISNFNAAFIGIGVVLLIIGLSLTGWLSLFPKKSSGLVGKKIQVGSSKGKLVEQLSSFKSKAITNVLKALPQRKAASVIDVYNIGGY